MDAGQTNQADLIDTTDCLEAISVFRGWKNFLFFIIFLALLLLQTSFWLVDTGYIKTVQPLETADTTQAVQLAELVTETPIQAPAENPVADTNDATQIKKAAQTVTADANLPVPAQPAEPAKASFTVKFEYIALAIRLLNYILAMAAVLYCLTLLFSLKVSLLGRLGGINHIARAFFRSLLMLVLLNKPHRKGVFPFAFDACSASALAEVI
jgi:hypothetical protein